MCWETRHEEPAKTRHRIFIVGLSKVDEIFSASMPQYGILNVVDL
jgi:hypothetical protein